jgi:hypothetical protein
MQEMKASVRGLVHFATFSLALFLAFSPVPPAAGQRYFGLYVSEVQVRSDGATGQDVKARTGVTWSSPREFVSNWLHDYLCVNFADVVLYQAKGGGEIGTVMFELDDIGENDLIAGTLEGVRGHSMDAWGGGGGPNALLDAAAQHGIGVVFSIQPQEFTQDQTVGIVSAAFHRFGGYPAFLGMVVDTEFCDTMETGKDWRDNELIRADLLRRCCTVRDHYQSQLKRTMYIFGVWYRTMPPPWGDGARPWHIYFPDVADLGAGLVPCFDGAYDDPGHQANQVVAGGAASPKTFGMEKTAHTLFFRKKLGGNWIELSPEQALDIVQTSWEAGNDFIEVEYWYHRVPGGLERCYGPEVRTAAETFLGGATPPTVSAVRWEKESLRITWQPFGTGLYTVETSSDLMQWMGVAGMPIDSTTWRDTGAPGKQRAFYRVRRGSL